MTVRAAPTADRQAGPLTGSDLLALEELGDHRFRSVNNLANHRGTIFGGQALCQGLAAAQRTVPGWRPHQLTGYFLRGGGVDQPVDYAVELVRDGRRYASRRVVASQAGLPILDLLCSFHDPEEGFAHQFAEPFDVPQPESLPSLSDYLAEIADRLPADIVQTYSRPLPFEVRPIDPEQVFFDRLKEPRRSSWIRLLSAGTAQSDADHDCLLALVSDYWLVGVAAGQHRLPLTGQGFNLTSLNHSMWFHAPVRADEWLLYRTDSPWAGEGRGVARGLLYDRGGRLVASVVQEAAMRLP